MSVGSSAARLAQNVDRQGRRRIVVVVKRLDENRYQAQLRYAAGGNFLFYGRREYNASKAKRSAEELFGPLEWTDAPERLAASEPGVLQIAYVNL